MVAMIDIGAHIKPKARFGMRHVQAILLFFTWILTLGMRVNMNIAIVDMTDPRNEEHFDWSFQVQSVILSSFFWVYCILQIFGGAIAARLGGAIPIVINMSINSVITLLVPFAARYGGWKLICACRVLQGLSQGLAIPACHNLIGKWAPTPEKSVITAFIYSGSYVGIALQYMSAGFVAAAWGWPAIFYLSGTLGAIGTILFALLGAPSPEDSKFISKEEKLYIQTSLGQVGTQKKLKVPWRSILTSVPFLVTCFCHCSLIWGFNTMMVETPSYLKHVLNIDIKASGMISAFPYLLMYFLSFVMGLTSDFVTNRGWLSTTNARKLSNSIGAYGPALGMIAITYVPPGSGIIAIILLTLTIALSVGTITGTTLVFLDLSPNFAGILLGLGNGVSYIMNVFVPLVAGAVINDETDPNEWRKVFYIGATIYIVGATMYLFLGTSDKQKWDNPEYDNKDSEKVSK